MKKFLLIFVILVGIIAVVRGLKGEDDWICQNGIWVKHGMPSAPMPTSPCPGGPGKEVIMELTSSAFNDRQALPIKYSCDGDKVSPPLSITDVPGEAKSLVLILDDPDAPMGTFNHWLVWNINPKTTALAEDKSPSGATAGTSTAGTVGYTSPCPPSGTHRYIFTLYALDTTLTLTSSAKKADLVAAMQNHIVSQTSLTSTYSHK